MKDRRIPTDNPNGHITCTWYRSSGEQQVVRLDRSPTLQELQAFVGGYVQIVPMPDDYQGRVWCNENGLLEPPVIFNKAASILQRDAWLAAVPRDELNMDMLGLVGDVVIVTGEPPDPRDEDEEPENNDEAMGHDGFKR